MKGWGPPAPLPCLRYHPGMAHVRWTGTPVRLYPRHGAGRALTSLVSNAAVCLAPRCSESGVSQCLLGGSGRPPIPGSCFLLASQSEPRVLLVPVWNSEGRPKEVAAKGGGGCESEVYGGAVKDPFCQGGQTLSHLLACLGPQGDQVQHCGVAGQAQTTRQCAVTVPWPPSSTRSWEIRTWSGRLLPSP